MTEPVMLIQASIEPDSLIRHDGSDPDTAQQLIRHGARLPAPTSESHHPNISPGQHPLQPTL